MSSDFFAINKIKGLTRVLNKYRDAYYNNSESKISDEEYDKLFDELQKLEEKTGFHLYNSPTQTVGYEVQSELKKVEHSHPMLSLDKTKSVDDLRKFAGDKDCLLSLKMDGLTLLLTYENGELVRAETRGNGIVGEDVTHTAKAFENIPHTIPYKGRLEVEGEAIITYKDFEKINSGLSEDEKYKNPRNLASGSVRQLDPNVAAKRHLRFIAWKVPYIENELTHLAERIKSIKVAFNILRLFDIGVLGFDIVPFVKISKENIDSLEELIEHLQQEACVQRYPIDGLVITYDDIVYGESLGATGHHPRHSLAYKFYEEEVETTLRAIDWTMGKTGVLTPTAVFDTVEIDGTDVSRASIHNISIMRELKLGIGDEITVYKANAIIPQIRDNLTRGNSIKIPKKCPICGGDTEIQKDNDTQVLVCTNPNCQGKLLGKLCQAVSQEALNIDGLSEKTLDKFIKLGWLNKIKDIYHLEKYKLYELEGFGKASIDNLFSNIEKSRHTTLSRFIYSLSIPIIGRKMSREIASLCQNDVNLFIKSGIKGEFYQIDGFGDAAHDSLVKFFENNLGMVESLLEEFEFEKPESSSSKLDLSGKTFVITGSLVHYKNRKELVEAIENAGGKVSGSVSSKTNFLVNNDKNSTSTKNKKAQSLGIAIVTEEEIEQMLK